MDNSMFEAMTQIAQLIAKAEHRPEKSPPIPDRLLTITQAAQLTGLSRSSIYRVIDAGGLKPVFIRPGCRRIRLSELARMTHGVKS